MQLPIYDYLSYRDFLQDVYNLKKEQGGRGALTWKMFADMAGYASKAHIKSVCTGERNISMEAAERLSRHPEMGLGRDEGRYFCALVAFEHPRFNEDKAQAFETICALRFKQANAEMLERARMDQSYVEFWVHWYNHAIRALMDSPRFKGDPAWISKQLVPNATKQELRSALECLEGLGQLERDGEEWRPTPQSREAWIWGHETEFATALQAFAIKSYHRSSPL